MSSFSQFKDLKDKPVIVDMERVVAITANIDEGEGFQIWFDKSQYVLDYVVVKECMPCGSLKI